MFFEQKTTTRMSLRRVFALAFVVALVEVSDAAGLKSSAGPVGIVKDTNLLTGLYYQITFPSTPPGVFTWAGIYTSSGERYVQMDDHEGKQANYVRGGNEYKDALWYFAPSKRAPYVFIRNAAVDGELLIADPNLSKPQEGEPEDHYAVLSKYDTYQEFGELTSYALWEIRPSSSQGFYTLWNVGLNKFVSLGERLDYYKFVMVDTEASPFQTNLKFKLMEVDL